MPHAAVQVPPLATGTLHAGVATLAGTGSGWMEQLPGVCQLGLSNQHKIARQAFATQGRVQGLRSDSAHPGASAIPGFRGSVMRPAERLQPPASLLEPPTCTLRFERQPCNALPARTGCVGL